MITKLCELSLWALITLSMHSVLGEILMERSGNQRGHCNGLSKGCNEVVGTSKSIPLVNFCTRRVGCIFLNMQSPALAHSGPGFPILLHRNFTT